MNTEAQIVDSWSSTKSYATLANLNTALVKLGLANHPGTLIIAIPCGPKAGRLTAVFAKSFFQADQNFMYPVFHGFKVMG